VEVGIGFQADKITVAVAKAFVGVPVSIRVDGHHRFIGVRTRVPDLRLTVTIVIVNANDAGAALAGSEPRHSSDRTKAQKNGDKAGLERLFHRKSTSASAQGFLTACQNSV